VTSRAKTPPQVSQRLLTWFARYVRWYLRRNFHGLHLLRLADLDQFSGMPVLICLNHPSWWDPLVALHLSQRFFGDRLHAAPIAAEGLAKYKFFERFGFFGIEPGTRRGASRFLEVGSAMLSRPDGAFWVTAQGEFTDVRQPIVLERGIGHVARNADKFVMLPLALEYGFWNERYSEAFACFGEAVFGRGVDHVAAEWTGLFRASLQATVDALSERVQQRRASNFERLLQGNAGVGGVYDLWRAVTARLRRKQWQPEHGGR
jgi:hypothetical protein